MEINFSANHFWNNSLDAFGIATVATSTVGLDGKLFKWQETTTGNRQFLDTQDAKYFSEFPAWCTVIDRREYKASEQTEARFGYVKSALW